MSRELLIGFQCKGSCKILHPYNRKESGPKYSERDHKMSSSFLYKH